MEVACCQVSGTAGDQTMMSSFVDVWGRALSWRRTIPDDNMPLLLFFIVLHRRVRVSQYAAAVIVPGSMNSTSKVPLQSQNTVAISFLLDKVCLNFFGLLDECVCIHCFNCSFVLAFPVTLLLHHCSATETLAQNSSAEICERLWTVWGPIVYKICGNRVEL